MKRSCRFSLPVTVASTAITYIYFSTVFVFIDQWFGLRSSPGIMNAVVFTAVALMCVFNYFVAIFTDPGRVPSTFVPDVEDAENPIHEIKRKSGDLRYCQKCSHYKPPRAHHCRVCRRCVLRMVISGLLLVPLSVALSVLLGWHIYLILRNKTTIEYHEGVRAMWLAEKGGDVYSHPYDLGVYENLISGLGPNIHFWLCPTSRYIGSGLRFRTAYDKTAGASTSN